MQLTLRLITNADRDAYQGWIDKIKAHQYMSRFYPKTFDGQTFSGSKLLCWYIIVSDHQDIGTVWLEKERNEDAAVILGIMLGDEKKFGAGIGQKAIKLAINQSHSELEFYKVELNVRKTNSRALRCYLSTGFKIIEEGHKIIDTGETISVLRMRLQL